MTVITLTIVTTILKAKQLMISNFSFTFA